MPRKTVPLTLTLTPVAHGALAALAHLAGDDRAGRIVVDLVAAEIERRTPGAWARVVTKLDRPRAHAATSPYAIATDARLLFQEALTSRGQPGAQPGAQDHAAKAIRPGAVCMTALPLLDGEFDSTYAGVRAAGVRVRVVSAVHTRGHGEAWKVKHEDGFFGLYDSRELSPVDAPVPTRPCPCPWTGVPYKDVPGYVSGYGCPVCKAIGDEHLRVDG